MNMPLSRLTPTQLGDSGDARAIPILHSYLRNGGVQERARAASAIRKLSSVFKAECAITIDALLECAVYGNERPNYQLRQYSLLALERLDLSEGLEFWFEARLKSEKDDDVRKVIFRILAGIAKKKIEKSAPEHIRNLNEYLSRYSISSFWHITHIDHLWSICRYGILSHGDAHENRPVHDISDPDVQRWRTRKDPIYDRSIHDYAALYINPRNPMLYKRKDLNKELCLIDVCPTILLTQPYLLTDGNAASTATSFYHDYQDLDKLPWDVLRGGYWNEKPDGKRKMCSEVLIYPQVWPVYIKAIHVYQIGEYHRDVTSHPSASD